MSDEVEVADRIVWIRASRAVLDSMREGWSPPVQAHAEENRDGSWEITLREAREEAVE